MRCSANKIKNSSNIESQRWWDSKVTGSILPLQVSLLSGFILPEAKIFRQEIEQRTQRNSTSFLRGEPNVKGTFFSIDVLELLGMRESDR